VSPFRPATKEQARLRMALAGPSGSGKTYTALAIATGIAQGGKVALVDTERGSASKYADLFQFDVLELDSFHPQRYVDAIREADAAGYAVLIIDSLSHAWAGKDGALDLVDKAARRMSAQNTFAAWREVTPLHNQLVDAMLGCNCHLIVTLRSKQEYIQTVDDRGRTIIKKVGLAPVQREGIEYEFDIYADMDDATMVVHKSRCPAVTDLVQDKPGREVAEKLLTWLQGASQSADGMASGSAPAAPATPVAPGAKPDPAVATLLRTIATKGDKVGLERAELRGICQELFGKRPEELTVQECLQWGEALDAQIKLLEQRSEGRAQRPD